MWNVRKSERESHEACSENEWKVANDLKIVWTLETYEQTLRVISSCFIKFRIFWIFPFRPNGDY